MEDNVSYCGLVCETCPIYLATREQDPEKKHEMKIDISRQINEHYSQETKPEEVGDCDGCKAETGSMYCISCEIRTCAAEKGLENCAHCDEYACDKLQEFFAKDPQAKERLDMIRSAL
jgi:hypothetical protein